MRFVLIALLAASVSGAAWAGGRYADNDDCDALHAISIESIAGSVEATLDQALDALEDQDLHEGVFAEIEAEIDSALAELEVELAALDTEMDVLHEAREAEVEARVEAALGRMEIALERADYERFEDAELRNQLPDAPKRWRPRY